MSYRLLSDGVSNANLVKNLNAEQLNGSKANAFVYAQGLKEDTNGFCNGVFDVSKETSPAEVVADMPSIANLYGCLVELCSRRTFGANILVTTDGRIFYRHCSTSGAKRQWSQVVSFDDLNSYITRQEFEEFKAMFEEFKAMLSQPSATQSLISKMGGVI